MSSKLNDSKRMELICEFIKSGNQPEGFKIVETSKGQYRVSKVKTERETLIEKRNRAHKLIESIDARLKELDEPKEVVEDTN